MAIVCKEGGILPKFEGLFLKIIMQKELKKSRKKQKKAENINNNSKKKKINLQIDFTNINRC